MTTTHRFKEIVQIFENNSKPLAERRTTLRPMNDGDIQWLVKRVQKLENTLIVLNKIPFDQLSARSYFVLIEDALKDK